MHTQLLNHSIICLLSSSHYISCVHTHLYTASVFYDLSIRAGEWLMESGLVWVDAEADSGLTLQCNSDMLHFSPEPECQKQHWMLSLSPSCQQDESQTRRCHHMLKTFSWAPDRLRLIKTCCRHTGRQWTWTLLRAKPLVIDWSQPSRWTSYWAKSHRTLSPISVSALYETFGDWMGQKQQSTRNTLDLGIWFHWTQMNMDMLSPGSCLVKLLE